MGSNDLHSRNAVPSCLMPIDYKNNYMENLDWIGIEDELVSLHRFGQIEENPIFLD